MKRFIGEVAVAVVFLILLLLLANPWGLFMPDYVAMGVLAALAFLFGIFANLISGETGGDERERYHGMFADRIAFLAGSGILLIAVIAGELRGGADHWVLAALAAMIVAKVAALGYTRIKL